VSNELAALIKRVEDIDKTLAADFRRSVDAMSRRREFGLNFERHLPESVSLLGRRISVGDKVRFIPPRGETEIESKATWAVTKITGKKGEQIADLIDPKSKEHATRAVVDLVYVADFRDPIYPGLVSTGKVEQGGDKPFHTVINSENYHALEALLYTHTGQVDVIYIDPPYNTGAKDWKYNNDYVDGEDAYRHSKWLSFMERRLKVARRLLNPIDSVLIVTIDEKEYLRLGLLLQQTFPEADIQMVSAVINRAGTPRAGRFSRVDEYVFYVFIGDARVAPWTSTMLGDDETSATMPTVWFTAIRRGSGSAREDKKSGKASFYPVVIDSATGAFIRVGDPLPHGVPRSDFALAEGETAIWPLASDGRENRWRFSADQMRRHFANGTARLGRRDAATGLRPVTYLQPGTLANIENGTFVVTGRNAEGALELALGETAKRVVPRTVWNRTGHFARDHGSHLISALLPGRRFPYPKALYAVEDALRFVVDGKPDALVVDFFAGSGTTAHVVMRLNRQKGTRVRSISITNNEVGVDEQKALIQQGLRPGDAEWEALGICDYITKPRLRAAVTGTTPNGEHVKGDYKFVDEFPMSEGFEENIEFFTLTYENPALVELDLAFERITPLLWMRAGSQGRRIEERSGAFDVADTYGVLFDVDASSDFLAALTKQDGIQIAYIVTDDESQYQAIAGELPEGVESVRLYESYLRTFQINTERV
jgi:adenine-specific DNA-methyltransferase